MVVVGTELQIPELCLQLSRDYCHIISYHSCSYSVPIAKWNIDAVQKSD